MTTDGTQASGRRRFLAAAGSVAFGYGAPTALLSAQAWGQDDAEDIDELFWDQAEPAPDNLIKTRKLTDWPLWWRQPKRPIGVWEGDGLATDNAYLGRPYSSEAFTLTAEVLRRALQLTFIPEAELGERVLFGVRAATMVESSSKPKTGSSWSKSVRLVESKPDHFSPLCVLGVWNRRTDGLWMGRGSTVCNVAYMFGQAKARNRDKLCNLLPAGVYRYRVGTHRNGTRSRQPGAFRLASHVAVQRNFNAERLTFSVDDPWEFRGPDICDNIHAAYVSRPTMPKYSSAGCQVLEGTVLPKATRSRPTGAWRAFRIAAGLKPNPKITIPDRAKPLIVRTSEDGKMFTYVLFSGRELRLISALSSGQATNHLEKLRRGSQGPRVKTLQSALGIRRPDGDFGAVTQRLLINRQLLLLGQKADGVVTRNRLGVLRLPQNLFA